eukprot:CAMPEP_0178964930 /NCGR_PEP_ID=MMETSP0789-20121207/15968_1 /TAXON_ID=3005 /ORGANISM="Rhizosolenia setigera, Strain CCMP 1694" /LENGTH=659 /DNA_ID=CAMNT_0020649795 /DNA_START=179 /DNA_END=2158 /DNA_ORIENTATION=-
MKQTKISIRQSAGIIQESTLDKVDFVQLDLLELLDAIGVQEPEEPEVDEPDEVEPEPEPTSVGVVVGEKKLDEVEKVVNKPKKKKKVKKIKTIKKTTRPPTKEELLELFNEFDASVEISHHDMSSGAHLFQQNPSQQELSVELRRLQAQEVEFGKMQRIFSQIENEYSEVLKTVKSSSSIPVPEDSDSDELLQLTPSVTKNFTSVVHRLVEILMVKNVSGYSMTELDSLLEDGIEAIKNVQQNKVFLQYLEYLIFEVSGIHRKDNTEEISCDSKLSLPTDDDTGDIDDDITTSSDKDTLDEDEEECKEEEEEEDEEEESIPQDLSDLATKTHLLELGTEMEEALLKRTNQYAEAEEDNTEFDLPSPLLPDATLRIQKAIEGKIKYEIEKRQEKLKTDISTLAEELLEAREEKQEEESIIEEEPQEENTCVENVDHVYNTFKDSIQEHYKQSGSYNASGSKEINGAINVDLKSLVNTPLFFKSILLLDALIVGISGYNEHLDDLIDTLISYVDVDNKGSADENQKTKSFVGYYDDEDEEDNESSQFQDDDISSIGELLSIHLYNVLSEWEGFEIPEQVTSFYRENLQSSLVETTGGLQQKAFFTLVRGLDQSIQKSVEFLTNNKGDYDSGDYDYDDGKSLVDRILEEGMNMWEFIVDQVS